MKPISFEQERCKRVLNLLDSYLSNELLVETNHEVVKHLEECRTCAEAAQSRMRVKSLLQRAVASETPPADLKARIQDRLRSVSTTPQTATAWRAWPLAAAAALALALGGYALVRNWAEGDSSIRDQAALSQAVSDEALAILKIGLGDHVRCALEHEFHERILSSKTMTELLGKNYAGLVSLVRNQSPAGFELTAAHHCEVEGRSFVHLILRKPEGFVSLILTQKQNEAYPSDAREHTLESFGVKLHQARIDGLQVAGFETEDHLGFFVTGLEAGQNFQVASRLAPALSDYLSRPKM